MVDRLVVREGIRARLADSVETALKWGENKMSSRSRKRQRCGVLDAQRHDVQRPVEASDGKSCVTRRITAMRRRDFSLGELTPKHFSFNSHLGACPACHGLGTQLVLDPDLMISDPSKTLAEGAITPWRRGTKRMQAYYRKLQGALREAFPRRRRRAVRGFAGGIQEGALFWDQWRRRSR